MFGVGSVHADGLFCEGRWLRCHVGILYFVMGACARWDLAFALVGMKFCVSLLPVFTMASQHSVFVFVDFQAPSAARKHGFHSAATAALDQVRSLRVADW